ncbi:19353_t:CDS:1 [Gigaspora margarita]|uniref:19353_t:CDS:1 n=1 Tax=Gigaspora margarita TaxID=4874 RepID=A0ABN7W915_GIGMA|nr:19353_t:CDS:1 [Gigaspora margarita]
MSNAARQHKKRMNETPDQREMHRKRDRENKKRKRQLETDEQHNARLVREREQRQQRKMRSISETVTEHPDHQENDITYELIFDNIESEPLITEHPDHQKNDNIESEPLIADILNVQQISEFDHKLLRKFRAKMNKLKHNFCPVYNERFPSINIVKGECRRCYNDKSELKKFSAGNNMDPGDTPEELKGLTEIEEMLIAQIFSVVSVYYLCGGQYAYCGNVINFPQDIKEFMTRLSRHPSSLDILIVRRQSARGSLSFRDFNVRRAKVERALRWLKENNRYYTNINVDYEVL